LSPVSSLPPRPSQATIDALAAELRHLDPGLPLFTTAEAADLARLSHDYFDYSPLLVPLFSGQLAQLAVRASTVDQVLLVAGACARAVPARATTASACPWPVGWCWSSPACTACATSTPTVA